MLMVARLSVEITTHFTLQILVPIYFRTTPRRINFCWIKYVNAVHERQVAYVGKIWLNLEYGIFISVYVEADQFRYQKT